MIVEAFGVRFGVAVDDPALLPAVAATLPPGWVECQEDGELTRFSLASPDGFAYELARDEAPMSQAVELDVAIGLLDAQLRMEVATRATGWAFIHAGCVAVGERALVLPGLSFSGKTTLVRALLDDGATYLSDEYALLDSDGAVHPYPKPLSIRPDGSQRSSGAVRSTETAAAELGAEVGERALPVALIAALRYVPGASWAPEPLTPSQGALALLSHSVAVRHEPERVLAAARSAARGAYCIEGDRGEAGKTARVLLDLLARD